MHRACAEFKGKSTVSFDEVIEACAQIANEVGRNVPGYELAAELIAERIRARKKGIK
jgi:hypothetical protein